MLQSNIKDHKAMNHHQQYITLISGRKVRIVWNEQLRNKLIEAYSKAELEEAMKGSATFAGELFYMMAQEGEKVEGNDLAMDIKEFGRLVSISTLLEFVEAAKNIINEFNNERYQEKPPKVYFRN